MAMDFPASPTNGQTVTLGAVSYTWNGYGWVLSAGDSTSFVKKAGDGMSGNLTIGPFANARLVLNATGTTTPSIEYQRDGLRRWVLDCGSAASGDYLISRYNDAGTIVDIPLGISRSTGQVNAGKDFNVGGNATIQANLNVLGGLELGTGTTAYLDFHSNGSGGDYDVRLQSSGGNSVSPGQGTLTITAAGGTTVNGPLTSAGLLNGSGGITTTNLNSTSITTGSFTNTNTLTNNYGRILSAGANRPSMTLYYTPSTAYGWWNEQGNWLATGTMGSDGSNAVEYTRLASNGYFLLGSVQAYKPGGGPWSDSSDARIKNVLGEYGYGLDAINALTPKRFTFKGNDQITISPDAESTHKGVAESGKEFVGLIAQEAELVIPELVTQRTAIIDGVEVSDMRDLDSAPLTYTLINAVKELSGKLDAALARIAVLEG